MSLAGTLLVVAAVVLAACLGYLVAMVRSRSTNEARIREAETGRAALEATAAELRSQRDSLASSRQELQVRIETESARRVAAETALQKSEESLAQQREAVERTKAEMKAIFEALALDALTKSTDQFLKQAAERFDGLRQQAATELETRKVAIEGMVHPLADTLKSLQAQLTQVSQNESALGQAHQELASRIVELRRETGTLATALREPKTRGSWGELTLRRAVELAGMSSHCDFVEQQTLTGEAGRLRPDLTVFLPGGRNIAVDAKVPMAAFWKAAEATSERERGEAMEEHARLVRGHLRQLASKAYWTELQPAPEFVVMFLPGESFFSAALESDRQLLADALAGDQKVLPASPITLIALLMAVEHGWRQQKMEENAARITTLGKELYDRVEKFLEHLGGIRDGLDRAAKAYNSAVGSFHERLLPSARRLAELGAAGGAEAPALEPTEVELRQIGAPPEQATDPPRE